MGNIILVILILIIIMLSVLLFVNFISKKKKNNFVDIDNINYNIIDYTEDVKDIIESKSSVDKLIDDNKKIKDLGFSNCKEAISYYQNNNMDVTKYYDNSSDTLFNLCKKSLANEVSTENINNYEDLKDKLIILNENAEKILDNEVININEKQVKLFNKLIKDIPSNLKSVPYFNNNVSNDLIEKYYLDKLNPINLENPENKKYVDQWKLFLGNYLILEEQFILLNKWIINLSEEYINFIYENITLFKFPYKFISSKSNIILIKLESLMVLENITSYSNYDLKNLLNILNIIGIKSNNYLYISLNNNKNQYYNIETLDHETILQLKKIIKLPTSELEFNIEVY